jgi:hypothetical protein
MDRPSPGYCRAGEVGVPSKEQVKTMIAPGSREEPTGAQRVHAWIAQRVAADAQMRFAGAAPKVRHGARQEGGG